MAIDLNTLKENDLRGFSYSQTKDVIIELEKIRLPNIDGIDAIEKVETYYSFATIIKNRVDNHEFVELSEKGKNPEIKKLHMTLDLLLASFKFSLDVNKLQKRMVKLDGQVQNTVNDYNSKKTALEEQIKSVETNIEDFQRRMIKSDAQVKRTEKDYKKQKLSLEKKIQSVETNIEDFQKHLDDSEHTVLTHVLTLMGVFTAVITIIMSVVITSGSWLNSANSASAIVAFTVPNLVAILAVVVLLSLTFIYQRSFSNNHYQSKGSIWLFVGLFVLILIISCVMGWVTVSQTRSSKAVEVQYIIPPEKYSVVENVDEETGEKGAVYEFSVEGKIYKFKYDEKYLHDGNLYFCLEQETLE